MQILLGRESIICDLLLVFVINANVCFKHVWGEDYVIMC